MKKLAFVSFVVLSFGGVNETVWGMRRVSSEIDESTRFQIPNDEGIKRHCCDRECYCEYLDSIKQWTKIIEGLYDQNSKLRKEIKEYDSESTQNLEYSSEPYEFKNVETLVSEHNREILIDYRTELIKKAAELAEENQALERAKAGTSEGRE